MTRYFFLSFFLLFLLLFSYRDSSSATWSVNNELLLGTSGLEQFSTPTISFDCLGVTDVSSGECLALVDFFISTHGESWTSNTYWLGSGDPSPTSVCDWYGIQCFDGLYSLILPENNLSGYIPASFQSLGAFSLIYLRNNSISSIASGALISSHLQELNILHNQISFLDPHTFSHLPALKELYLSYNQLNTIAPGLFSGLSSLDILDLSYNNLTTPTGSPFSDLSSLRYLFLSHNSLTSIDATLFTGLHALKELYLSYNQLTSLNLSLFSGLISLEALYLSNNWLNHLIPFSSSSLQHLDIRNNCLIEGLSGSFSQQPGDIFLSPQGGEDCITTTSPEPVSGNNSSEYTSPHIGSSSDSSKSSVPLHIKRLYLLLSSFVTQLPTQTDFFLRLQQKPELFTQILLLIQKKINSYLGAK